MPSAKKQNNRFGFGTDNEMERSANYLVIKHDAFPPIADPAHGIENESPTTSFCCPPRRSSAPRARSQERVPPAVRSINISGMSFGALSAPAIEALNRGAAARGLHAEHRRGRSFRAITARAASSIFQIGTGYFGCRDVDGSVRPRRAGGVDRSAARSRQLEIKLTQGAKPGLGGILPAVEDDTGDRAHPRSRGRARTASARPRTPRSETVDELLEFVRADRRPRPVCRSASSPRSASSLLARARDAMRGDRRRRRTSSPSTAARAAPARHRSRSPTTSRCRSRSAFARVYATFAERGINERRRRSSAPAKLGLPEHRADRVRARLRHGQRRPRGDDGDRLHPGAALPHRPLPDRASRRRTPGSSAAWTRSSRPRAPRTTSHAARRAPRAHAHLRRVPPVARHARPARADGGGLPLPHRRGRARLPARLARGRPPSGAPRSSGSLAGDPHAAPA